RPAVLPDAARRADREARFLQSSFEARVDLRLVDDRLPLARHPVRFGRPVLSWIHQHEPGEAEVLHGPPALTHVAAVERLPEDDREARKVESARRHPVMIADEVRRGAGTGRAVGPPWPLPSARDAPASRPKRARSPRPPGS